MLWFFWSQFLCMLVHTYQREGVISFLQKLRRCICSIEYHKIITVQAFISMQWQETLLSIWQVHPHLDFFLLFAFSRSQGYLIVSYFTFFIRTGWNLYQLLSQDVSACARFWILKEIFIIWTNKTIFPIFWFTILGWFRKIDDIWHMHTNIMHCEIIERLGFKCTNKCKMPLEFLNISLVWNLKEKHCLLNIVC